MTKVSKRGIIKLTKLRSALSKNRLLVITVCLFLVHTCAIASTELGTSPINPARKVSPTELNIKELFALEFNILAFARGIYSMDVEERLTKADIKKRLADGLDTCARELSLTFDLDNIDFRKKGFTRYYPFNVEGKDFIVRIFDAREEYYLPDFEVFYEGKYGDTNIGFQIIPGLATILADTKIEKFSFPDPNLCASNP